MQSKMVANASLMGALLQHAGHLSEWSANNFYEGHSFQKCIQYVVLRFFKSNPENSFVDEIADCAVKHQAHITNPSLPIENSFPQPKWIAELEPMHDSVYEDIYNIKKSWDDWNPREELACIMKSSIEDFCS